MTTTPRCYAGRILRVDLSRRSISISPTSDYVDYVGGRWLGAKLYWDEAGAATAAFDPANVLIFMTGPLMGFAGLSSSRWQVYGRSPLAEREGFSYCNLGGSWGAALKSAGFDALVVSGQSDGLVHLLIEDGAARLVDAAHLKGMGAIDTRHALHTELGGDTSVVAIGPAGEYAVRLATLLAEHDASGGAGFGAVMGSKGLKAIALRKGSFKPVAAEPGKLKELIKLTRYLIGADYKTAAVPSPHPLHKDYCWGCPGPCSRSTYRSQEGKEGKFNCQPILFYGDRSRRYYNTTDDEVAFQAAYLCNQYGVDTQALELMITWLNRCYRKGILTEQETGLPLSQIGSLEYITSLLQVISNRRAFGHILAEGTVRAAAAVGKGAADLIGDILHKSEGNALYGPRLYILTELLYAVEPRQMMSQLHEISFVMYAWLRWLRGEDTLVSTDTVRGIAKRFWGSDAAADFTSYEGKAKAAKLIQERSYAKECLVVCDWRYPIMFSRATPDQVGDPSVESRILSAVTGRDFDEQGFYYIGEQALNLQRRIQMREGHRGREDDYLPQFCYDMPLAGEFMNAEMLVPGPNGNPTPRKGCVVDRQAFENLKSEFYRLRNWDIATGHPIAPS